MRAPRPLVPVMAGLAWCLWPALGLAQPPAPPRPAQPGPPQGAASATAASPAASPIALRWAAPEACPDRGAVVERIERLLGGPPAATDRRLDAEGAVEELPRGFRLDLRVASGDAESARVLQSVSCESLADAAALVIALAFDPDAVTAQEIRRAEADAASPAPPPSGSAQPYTEPPAPASAGGPIADTHGDAAPVSTAALIRIPVPIPARPPSPPAPPPRESRLSFGAFAAVEGDAGSLPSVAPGVRAGLSFGVGALRIEPSFEAWPSSRTALADRPSAGAELRLLAFALDACRRLLPWDGGAAAAEAFGCLGFEIGELRGEGFGVSSPSSGGALWAAPRAGLRAELPLARWAAITLDVGVAVPLDRKRFVLDLSGGRAAVHEPSPVSGRAGLGLAFRF